MPKIVVVSHNIKSNALKLLALKLGEKLGYTVFRVTPDRVGGRLAILFHRGIDKVTQFTAFRDAGVSVPRFCTRLSDVPDLGCREVVVRATTTGSEGVGITIVPREACRIQAPLYTEYIPKKKEFRLHVWNNQVIDVQEKRRQDGHESSQVRNTANGYVFCRGGIQLPAGADALALAAVRAVGRTQGGVDVIWNEQRNQSYVLEVNSRPGMEGTTVDKYADAIIASLPPEARRAR